MKIFDDLIAESNGDIFYTSKFSYNSDELDWRDPDPDYSVKINRYMTSRFVQEENLATVEARSTFVDALILTEHGFFDHKAGKGVIEADPYRETSVTPAWRECVSLYSINVQSLDFSKEAIKNKLEEASTLM